MVASAGNGQASGRAGFLPCVVPLLDPHHGAKPNRRNAGGERAGKVQDVIQPIIHKAEVTGLRVNIGSTGLSMGDCAELRLTEDGRVAVFAHVTRRVFLIRRKVLVQLGYLGPRARLILGPALQRGDHLRIRIVGLTPEHLAPDGKPEMHVSVWGQGQRFFADRHITAQSGFGGVKQPTDPREPREQALASS